MSGLSQDFDKMARILTRGKNYSYVLYIEVT